MERSPKLVYDSRLIVQIGNDKVTENAARNLQLKHPCTVLTKLIVNGSLQGVSGDLRNIQCAIKLLLVGHGNMATMEGKYPEQLAQIVDRLPS